MAFATELVTILETGAGLVVGTVSADGWPRADRAWAASVIDVDGRRLRLVMSADDPAVVDNLQSGTVSLTGAEVSTYQSVQRGVVRPDSRTVGGCCARRGCRWVS